MSFPNSLKILSFRAWRGYGFFNLVVNRFNNDLSHYLIVLAVLRFLVSHLIVRWNRFNSPHRNIYPAKYQWFYCAGAHTYSHKHTHTHTHTHAHSHAHSHTHAHTHTHSLRISFLYLSILISAVFLPSHAVQPGKTLAPQRDVKIGQACDQMISWFIN